MGGCVLTAILLRNLHTKSAIHNKMERLNGEIRDREKTSTELKRKRTPILSGYQIYHNYIRGHESFDGKTPAEACGIKIEDENKWKTIIQNASTQLHSGRKDDQK